MWFSFRAKNQVRLDTLQRQEISSLSLLDIRLVRGHFTWLKIIGNCKYGLELIDFFYPEWEGHFSNVSQRRL
jgi:hypothetical protein